MLLLLLLLYLQQLLLLLLLLAPWLLLYVVYDALHRRYHLVIWRTCGCSAILYPKRSVPFALYSVLYPYPSVYFSQSNRPGCGWGWAGPAVAARRPASRPLRRHGMAGRRALVALPVLPIR